jgi:hypothetical protein
LAQRRSAVGWPVFALEHGLSEADLRRLLADVTNAASAGPPKHSAYLPWVVYASEFGYRYSGYEYWQTFALETPGWAVHGQRELIRTYFQLFSATYNGAEPEGAWAEHFSIIAWPITHAVLPRDLQRRLAQLLFEARHTFRDEVFDSAESLGRHLQSLSRHQSSRFIQFAENVTLLGQIAGALLLQDPGREDGLLSAPTLERLVRDIGRERASKEWLSEAVSTARQLRGMRGLRGRRSSDSPMPTGGQSQEASRQLAADLGIEPRLLARPTGSAEWEVLLQIPSLSPLQSRYRGLRALLVESRGVFIPTNKPIARQGLLYGLLEPLRNWPEEGSALVCFEGCTPDIKFLFDTVLGMPRGPRWLFKVLPDGHAVHVKGSFVRPGASYLLLSPHTVERPAPGLAPIPLSCRGIYATRFDVPDPIDDVWEALVPALGLTLSRRLEVWPVGFPPAYWDDEGSAHWLLSKDLVLAVRADHPVDSIVLRKGGQTHVLEVPHWAGGGPVFVHMGNLAEGRHRIDVGTITRDSGQQALQGYLDILVRPPRVWSADRPASGPVRFLVDPLEPTLEDLWEGRVEVHLSAPGSISVRPTVRLLGEQSDKTLFERSLPPMKLPIATDDWLHAFQTGVRGAAVAQERYDEAQSCRVEFDAGVLGCHQMTCERAFTPLRWIARTESHQMVLRLVDNSGRGHVDVREYDFACPDCFKQHLYEAAEDGIAVDSDGGLYLAKGGADESAIIAVRTGVVRSLDALGVKPRLAVRVRDVKNVLDLLEVARIWGAARISGSALSSFYRQNVRVAISMKLAGLIAGEAWERAERDFAETGRTDPMKRAVSSAPHQRGLSAAVSLEAQELAAAPIPKRIARLVGLTKSFPVTASGGREVRGPRPADSGVVDSAWIWEFALRVASEPERLVEWAGSHAEEGIQQLLVTPMVFRAARYLVLLVDQQVGVRSGSSGALYQGWSWT